MKDVIGRWAITKTVRHISALGALAIALLAAPLPTTAQVDVEVSTGILMDLSASVGPKRVGPMLSVGLSNRSLGVPLMLEATVARTDFTSLGQDYHQNYYLFVLGTQWSPFSGPTRLAFRFGLGASGEYQIIEPNSDSGGDSWVEAVVPGLVLEHDLGGLRIVAGVSDYILGVWWAVLDPEESNLEHRWKIAVGLRF